MDYITSSRMARSTYTEKLCLEMIEKEKENVFKKEKERKVGTKKGRKPARPVSQDTSSRWELAPGVLC